MPEANQGNLASIQGLVQATVEPCFVKQSQHKKYIPTYAEAINAVVEDVKQGSGANITKEEASKMLKGVVDFSAEDYTNIRNAYNNPKAPRCDRERMEALDAYLKKAPKWEGEIYRGINVSWDVANDILSKPDDVDMKGPSSWSSEEMVAESFASIGSEAVRMLFVLKENKSGASITHIASYNGTESELTVPSGVKYAIESVKHSTIHGMPWIHVYVKEKS